MKKVFKKREKYDVLKSVGGINVDKFESIVLQDKMLDDDNNEDEIIQSSANNILKELDK